MENTVPKNWVEINLKDSVDFRKGKKPKILKDIYFDNSVPYRDIKGLETDTINFYADKESAKYFKDNDVVIVWDGSRSGLILKPKEGAIGSTLGALSPFVYKSEYLYYFLLSHYETINSKARGVGIPHVDPTYLWNLSVPLPPLAEQERIVAKLDALFAQQEVIKKAISRIPDLLKDFRQQVLTQAVTGKLTASWREGKKLEAWKEAELGEVCNLKAGKFVSASEISIERHDGYYPCYGANGLRGYVKTFTHIGKYSLIGRQGALCGNVHLIDGQFHATEHALVVTPIKTIDNIWMFYKLTSLDLINYAKGVAQPGLSVMNLNPIPINIPPLEEQQEIVTRVESLFAKTDAIKELYKNLKEKIDTLPQAILHKAFKGELIEQLSTDGDASDLLKEIMALKNLTLNNAKVNSKKSIISKVSTNSKIDKIKNLKFEIKKILKTKASGLSFKDLTDMTKSTSKTELIDEVIKDLFINKVITQTYSTELKQMLIKIV